MTTPLVSVIMPVYNGRKYLSEAVSSILSQSLPHFELIVVDDGSSDDSSSIVEGFRDERIRLIRNSENRGVAFSLNRAIETSRGEFIARMDSDDVAYTHRLERQVEFLKKHHDVGICGSSVRQFGGKRGIFPYPETDGLIRAHHLFNPSFAHPAVCWRKSLFIEKGLKYQEDPPTAEDYQLWVELSDHTKMANLREPLLNYRVDASIKISSYLEQQRSGGRQIRAQLLEKLGKWQSDELEIHHHVAEGREIIDLLFLKKTSLNFSKIVKINQNLMIFDENSLNLILSEYWFRVLSLGVRNRCVSFSQLLRFSREKKAFKLSSRNQLALWRRLFLKKNGG
ncbi:MAG: glycosyltransferase [Opitutales bacterium]|nr:glycosyltransferase [Opitutales bacterium]